MEYCKDCDREFENKMALGGHNRHEHPEKTGMDKKCMNCGSKFTCRPSQDAIYCSTECQHEDSKKRLTLICEICEGGFEVTKSREDTARFCSMDCKRKADSERMSGENNHMWDGGLIEKDCLVCGDNFEIKPARQDNAKFCSLECKFEFGHTEETKNLIRKGNEGNEFTEEERDNISKGLEQYYAEDPSRHWNYKGGDNRVVDEFGPHWRRTRRKVLEENPKCAECGMTREEHYEEYGRDIEINHIKPRREFFEEGVEDWDIINDLDNLEPLCIPCHRNKDKNAT